jgi:hypothetical protein
MAFRAPQLGYNTNVRHKGKLYHIQTEDSGIDHPHVVTHLFADGGRIVASKKTSYADRVGSEGLPDQVKKLMQAQHKAMFIALRDGIYDEDGADNADASKPTAEKVDGALVAEPGTAERALPPREAEPASASVAEEKPGERASLYQNTQTATRREDKPEPAPARPRVARSLFGGDTLGDKSLDEVILNYLAAHEPNENGR